jgi:hypothetical protein
LEIKPDFKEIMSCHSNWRYTENWIRWENGVPFSHGEGYVSKDGNFIPYAYFKRKYELMAVDYGYDYMRDTIYQLYKEEQAKQEGVS